MAVSFIALGANLAGPFGPPEAALQAALARLESDKTRVTSCSRLYRSPAWPNPADPEFRNAVCRVETMLTPAELLEELHRIEAEFGRARHVRNAPRTLDLDILDYAGRVSAPGEVPVLPHPSLEKRDFVLLPLAEVAPNWRHPVSGYGIAALIVNLSATPTAEPLP